MGKQKEYRKIAKELKIIKCKLETEQSVYKIRKY